MWTRPEFPSPSADASSKPSPEDVDRRALPSVPPANSHPVTVGREALNVKNLLNRLAQDRLIGIVRTDSAESAIWASTHLLEAGFRWIEIPFTVPDTQRVIETLSERFPDAVMGAGTVLEAKQAVLALGAGAQFLVSPVLNEPLIQLGLEQDLLVLPGCVTPTEIYKAHTLGAPAVKFFPAEPAGGVEFLKAVRAPLPDIPLVPTGGISLEQVPKYLAAGALAVGVGGPLLPKAVIAARDAEALQSRAKAYLQSIQSQDIPGARQP